MPLRLFNSLSRAVEPFVPNDGNTVHMFVCGPTVYDFIHIGNARTFTSFDMIAKWLRFRDFDVTYLQNITDVDDRIINRASQEQTSWKDIADRYTAAFLEDMQSLSIDAVSRYARATDHIPQVIAQVKSLIAKGNVYRIDGDGWYFDLTTFPDYGKLSGRTALEAEDAVSRIDDSSKKRNAGDFCVWKLSKPGEPSWEDEELGTGRPGWHIEDTAITEDAFGPQYDLHGGAIDLKFPHHEAEIAQQEAASGLVPFVKYWMHGGFLQVNQARMGKSVGNMMPVRDALQRWSAEAIRFFLLSGHYRSPLEFSDQALDASAAAVQRIVEVIAKLDTQGAATESSLGEVIRTATDAIGEAMDDDFNVPRAFAAVFDVVKTANITMSSQQLSTADTDTARTFFDWISRIFGIVPSREAAFPADIQALIDQRQAARDAKDFAESDRLREQIAEMGFAIDDTPYGPLVKRR